MAVVLTALVTSCYEKPEAKIDELIEESLGSVPVAADYTFVGDAPVVGGQVSFTFNFWSDVEIATINMYSSVDGGTTLVLEQTNTFADAAYSEYYDTDTIAYTFDIPTTLVSKDAIQYIGEVINENTNSDSRTLTFEVQ